jgi:hypothetical protein
MHWLWRPPPGLLRTAVRQIEALPHGARLLRGEYIALVLATCPTDVMADKYPHVLEQKENDPCSVDKEWTNTGRLDTAVQAACYAHVRAATCAFERAGFTCEACTSLGHFRLQRFIIAAQQVRATAPEAGQLNLAVIVTDDAEVRSAASDGSWLASHPSWSIVVLALEKTSDVADIHSLSGQLLSALLLLRHARHIGTKFFEFLCFFFAALYGSEMQLTSDNVHSRIACVKSFSGWR